MIKAQIVPAVLLTLTFTVFTGGIFPLLVWIPAQLFFSVQANGSFIVHDAKPVGSALIGQIFVSPHYFHPRPSAAGAGYDPMSSSGTNLGPTSKKLYQGLPDDPTTSADETYFGIEKLAIDYRAENGLEPDTLIPADAVTRSASGLDPHISPSNARLQAARIAKARGLDKAKVVVLIDEFTEGRFIGLFGEPRVNVLKLNLALDGIDLH